MKRIRIAMNVILILAVSVFAEQGQKLGKEITLTDTVAIGKILANPEAYVGKKVLIKGTVVDVCDKAGCWMEVTGKTPEEKIKVKVKDGVIVFPQSAKGKTALVEGKVEKLVLSEEQAKKFAAHEAEEKGQKFDPSTVKGPMTVYRIRGIGAVIYNMEK